MYNRKITKKLDFYSGITYTPQSNLRSQNERDIYSIKYLGDLTSSPLDYLDTITSRTTIKLPSKLAIGLGVGESKNGCLVQRLLF